jgi:hypothetical protein
MPIDAGLPDRCLFLNQGPGAQWWLSSDVVVTGFDGVPVPVGNRSVRVTTRCASGNNCAGVSGTAMRVELWVADPALVIDKTNPNTCRQIGIVPKFAPTSATPLPVDFAWTVVSTGTGPDSPGHKCLFGIVYPQLGNTPDAVNFYPPDDTHYAQKNLCIVTCSSPCGQDIQTVNASRNEPENVIIRAVADPKPSAALVKVLTPSLKAFKKFRRFSPLPPPPFGFKFSRVKGVKITDYQGGEREGSFGTQKAPNVEASLVLKPKQRVSFRLSTDLGKVPLGDGFIIHVTHNVGNVVRGGVTVVFVKV